MSQYTLYHGDCLDALARMDDGSVDGIVSDPPAGISFMGAAWDAHKGGRDRWIAWLAERMSAARRVVKPGHYGLIWALPRTSHWTATACEDAGWIIEDRVSHLFGSGFPKNKNKLKPAVEDWWLIRNPGPARGLEIDALRVGSDIITSHQGSSGSGIYGFNRDAPLPAHTYKQAAGRWPAHLVLSHADDCVPCGERRVPSSGSVSRHQTMGYGGNVQPFETRGYADADGMETIDAYACVDGCPIRALDAVSGVRRNGGRNAGIPYKASISGLVHSTDRAEGTHFAGDTGTASRFFTRFDPPFTYAAKASSSERHRALDDFYWAKDDSRESKHRRITRAEWEALAEHERARGNIHPTVKSEALMKWLISLITDPGDTVLDLFAGTGSTAVAAAATGRAFVGVERNEDYHAIALARCVAAYDPLAEMVA
jgi:DNA modification methylase